MSGTVAWLVSNRSRPSPLTRPWLKAWGKRVYNLPALVRHGLRRRRLQAGGANIAPLSFVAPGEWGGSLKNLRIGRGAFVGRVSAQLVARIDIGEHVVINDGVRLITGSHDVDDPQWRLVAKPIIIRDRAWVGTGAMILPGVTVGRCAVVGAGAVVTRDVPDFAVVAGNPARVIRQRALDDPRYDPTRRLAVVEAWLGREESGTP